MRRFSLLLFLLSSGCLLISGALTRPICGDEFIHVDRDEECDDGNNADGDGCNQFCLLEFCGDGLLNNLNQEACDDGNNADDDGCNQNCQLEFCGDGLINNLNESCDDGAHQNGDGCDKECKVEFGFICVGEPSDCNPLCGDGRVLGGEECDDNNLQNNDGCSALCQEELGFNCFGEPSLCNAICGDGRIVSGEECDDDNNNLGDGCNNLCALEAPGCVGGPNGVTEAGEVCDTNDLNGADCSDLGFSAGNLACNVQCGFDTQACTP